MPLLEHLEEFRSSFLHIANEAQALEKSELPPEDFPLPDSEPPSPFPAELDGSNIELRPGDLNPDDLGLDLPATDFSDLALDSSLGLDVLNNIPDSGPDLPPVPDDFGLDTPESADLPPVDFSDMDLSGSPDLGGQDIGLPGDSGGDFNLDDLGDAGIADDGISADGTIASEGTPPDAGFDFSGFDEGGIDLSESMDLGGEEPGSGFGVPLTDVSGMDFGNGAPQSAPSGGPLDDLDMSDFSAGADLSESMDLGGEEPGNGFGVPMDDVSGMDFGNGTDAGFDLPQGMDFGSDAGSGGFDSPDFSAGADLSQSLDLGGEEPGDGFGVPMDDVSGMDFGNGTDAGFGDASSDFGDAGSDFGDAGSDFGDAGSDFGDGSAMPDFGGADSGFGDGSAMPDFGGADSGFGDAGSDFGGGGDAGSDFGSSIPDFEEPGSDFGSAADSSVDMPEFEDAGDASSFDISSFDAPEGDGPPLPEPILDTPDFSAPIDDGVFDDFSLPGFDDIPQTGKGRAQPVAGRMSAVPTDDVEEINLSDEEYKQLLETLSVYPLNLRIACEELIAEQAVAPDLMVALVRLLVRGAPARETAVLAGKILGRTITIPKGYTKKTGAEMEAEQASFGYIFVHQFLPVLRLFAGIAVVAASLGFLCWTFIIVPMQAENLYKEGYAQLHTGEYTRANDLFRQAFEKRRVKNWFYRYAEGFRDERQYIFAEQKYDQLLRVYPRDKKGALDYAAMETYYLRNYEKADRIIRNNILDYAVDDKEGLLALAENNLEWGETDPSRYEDARAAYARLMEKYGRKDPYLEGMLKYFIRTDQLNEVLPLQAHFMSDPKKRKITVPTLAELGGYLLDKRFQETEGVPQEYADRIEGIRDVLLRAINEDGSYPESYYHLARYYHNYGSALEERQSLKDAISKFNAAGKETPKRAAFRIDAHRRLGETLINTREFFPAEEELIRGVRLYEDARARQVLKTEPMFGRLYADLGDLEFFAKDGNMEAALRFYQEAERNLWAPPEVQYRMGAAHYQLEQWEDALMRFFPLVPAMPGNRRLLYAMGNISFLRGNYFAAQGYYNRLMDLLDAQRVRFPDLNPDNRPEAAELTERLMVAENNLGVTLEALTRISGDTSYRSRALGLFANSIRAWDVLTRDPETMNRMRPFADLYGPGVNLAYLNVRAITLSEPNYDPQIFMRIDRDGLEPSPWEELVSRDYRLSDQLLPMAVE